jgi:hypothetical protein
MKYKATPSPVPFAITLTEQLPDLPEHKAKRQAQKNQLKALGIHDIRNADSFFRRLRLNMTMEQLFKVGGRKKEPLWVEYLGQRYEFEPTILQSRPGELPVVLGRLSGSRELFYAAMQLSA